MTFFDYLLQENNRISDSDLEIVKIDTIRNRRSEFNSK